HTHWAIRLILICVAFLHTHYHVPFLGCSAILFCLNWIFLELGIINEPIPTTLTIVLRRLGLKDQFLPYRVCLTCHKLFPPTVDAKTECCGELLFYQTLSTDLPEDDPDGQSSHDLPRPSPRPVPRQVVPFTTLSSLLEEYLSRPGMEDALESWRTREKVSDDLETMQDGRIWKELKGKDGKLFFDKRDDSELRIGVTVGLDWYASYTLDSFRYRIVNVIIAGLTAGPNEPTAEELQQYLELVVDDFVMLWEHGKLYVTAKHPNGIYDFFAVSIAHCLFRSHSSRCRGWYYYGPPGYVQDIRFRRPRSQ
ncbi:hypothetical protein C8J56DRAFT_774881, partial [Mycena floridula]